MLTNWRLVIGCHNGTWSSRDDMVEEHPDRDSAYKSYLYWRETWARIGYRVWYARIVGPGDTPVEHLESNHDYE